MALRPNFARACFPLCLVVLGGALGCGSNSGPTEGNMGTGRYQDAVVTLEGTAPATAAL